MCDLTWSWFSTLGALRLIVWSDLDSPSALDPPYQPSTVSHSASLQKPTNQVIGAISLQHHQIFVLSCCLNRCCAMHTHGPNVYTGLKSLVDRYHVSEWSTCSLLLFCFYCTFTSCFSQERGRRAHVYHSLYRLSAVEDVCYWLCIWDDFQTSSVCD